MVINFIIITAILSILIILIWKVLNKINFFKKRKTLKTITTIISAFILYYFCIMLVFGVLIYERDIDFDETVWKNEITKRPKMIENLINSDYLIGKNTSEVKEVFGRPYRVYDSNDSLTYSLRGHHGFADVKIVYVTLYLKDSIVKSFKYHTVYDD